MLFTYIDNGFFRPLGETEKLEHVDVRIVAATTENPKSNLLRAFTRRIPMIITLPPIKDRSLSERYAFIETFIKEESHRIGRSIYINKNSIISYLLYDCPNNIGQLKSDIQLACAKAFLNYRSEDVDYILITQGDLPNHVRKGIMKINKYRNEIEELLNINYDIFKFNQYGEPPLLLEEDKYTTEDFYHSMEEKLESLKNMGLSEQDINEIINIDIEAHFEKYIGNISSHFNRGEIANIVDEEILELVEGILLLGEKELNKKFNENIYYALSFHLDRSIERIQKGEKIYNPKLNSIRINYEDEFLLAMKAAKIIDRQFAIETPVDEIGYLAMLFAAESYWGDKIEKPKVGILVIMHEESTASSMVEVANSLIGTDHAVALEISWVPVFSAMDILAGPEDGKLDLIFQENHMCSRVALSLKEHLLNIDGEKLVREIRYLLYQIQYELDLQVSLDVKMGIALHICFLIDSLGALIPILDQVWWGSLAIMTLLVVFSIGYNLAKSYEVDPLAAGLIAVGAFFATLPQAHGDAGWGYIHWGYLQATGLFTGIVVSLIATEIFVRLIKRDLTIKMPEEVPPAVGRAFASVIPGMVTILVFGAITRVFFDSYVHLGGAGATLALIVAIFLVTRHRKEYREVAKLSAASGVFQINEPMMFGLPLVLNPILFIPFIITPGILTLIAYIATITGFAPATYIAIPWTTPPVIGAFLATGGSIASIKAAIVAAVNFIVAILIYIPFVRLADRQRAKSQ